MFPRCHEHHRQPDRRSHQIRRVTTNRPVGASTVISVLANQIGAVESVAEGVLVVDSPRQRPYHWHYGAWSSPTGVVASIVGGATSIIPVSVTFSVLSASSILNKPTGVVSYVVVDITSSLLVSIPPVSSLLLGRASPLPSQWLAPHYSCRRSYECLEHNSHRKRTDSSSWKSLSLWVIQ